MSDTATVRAALERAIASGASVTIVVRLESGRTREVRGVPTNFYKGHDGKERLGLLIGVQTQQAVLVESIAEVTP
jgi:hypothetical protein